MIHLLDHDPKDDLLPNALDLMSFKEIPPNDGFVTSLIRLDDELT